MKIKIILINFLLIISTLIITTGTAHALECTVIPNDVCQSILGSSVTTPGSPSNVITPLANAVINVLVGVFGLVLILIMIISGVQMSVSAGSQEIVKRSKENIFKAVSGLVLLICFRAILSIVNYLFSGVNTTTLFVGNTANNVRFAPTGVPQLLSNAIQIASFAAGSVSVIFLIVGGISYITSAGGEGIVKAKKTIVYALSGLVLSVTSYAILLFIQSQLQ